MEIDYITVKVTPTGLGNILFMVFAGYVVSKQKKLKLRIFLPDKQQHNLNNFDYYDIFFKKFTTRILSLDNTEQSKYIGVPAFSNWYPEKIAPGSIMASYFQYYPPLKPYESDIRELVLESLQPYRERIMGSGDFKDRVFLHIRRGDYLLFPNYWFLPSVDYYKRAVNILKPIKPVIIVSNDIKWVKEHEYFSDTRYFEIFEGDELDTLAVMSLCTAGAICANSSFSWWGAFLGTHSERNKVIIPRNWVGDNIHGLFPDEWLAVDST
jgi:hypothetical protein